MSAHDQRAATIPARRVRLTPKMREAIALLREHGVAYTNDPTRAGWLTTGPTSFNGYEPAINFRTAEALDLRGLGYIDAYGTEEANFVLYGDDDADE